MVYGEKAMECSYKYCTDVQFVNKSLQKLKLSKKRGGKALLHNTLRGYVCSIQHLLNFLIVSKQHSSEGLETVKIEMGLLTKGMKKPCLKENWQRKERESNNNIWYKIVVCISKILHAEGME